MKTQPTGILELSQMQVRMVFFLEGSTAKVGIGTSSPDGALHVKGISDHGRIVLESGGTSGSDNNMFMQFHNGGGTEIAQIAIEEGSTNVGQFCLKLVLQNA